ncbi:MAG: hypothetical protein KKA81_06975 [Bacteroidetes bacterium]|nr:hypothetical protein [Bacteroidota bacterium]
MKYPRNSTYHDYVRMAADFFIRHPELPGHPGLMTGNAGVCLFLFHAANYLQDAKLYDHAADRLNRVTTAVCNNISFTDGLPGIGWTLAFLAKRGFVRINSTGLQSLYDDPVMEIMLKNMHESVYELLYGYLGCGVYFLERTDTDTGKEALHRIIRHLAENTPPASALPGMAHGIAGILSFLASCYKHNLNPESCREIMHSLVPRVNAFAKNFPDSPAIPGKQIPGDTYPYNPFGWCHGLAGMGWALYKAGYATKNREWMSYAYFILNKLRNLLQKNGEMLPECGLCHGQAGVAHIFRKLYLHTKSKTHLQFSRYWLEKSLKCPAEQAIADDGECPCENGIWEGIPYGLLTGPAGNGLACLTVINKNMEPGWDECLLIG